MVSHQKLIKAKRSDTAKFYWVDFVKEIKILLSQKKSKIKVVQQQQQDQHQLVFWASPQTKNCNHFYTGLQCSAFLNIRYVEKVYTLLTFPWSPFAEQSNQQHYNSISLRMSGVGSGAYPIPLALSSQQPQERTMR